MEERHAANDWISKIHDKIDSAAVGDIHGIDPRRIFHWRPVSGIREEVNLMDVKRMNFFG